MLTPINKSSQVCYNKSSSSNPALRFGGTVSRFVLDDICSALFRTSCFAKDTSEYPIKRRFKNDNRIT